MKDRLMCFTPWDIESIRTYDANGVWHTLYASSDKSGLMRDSVVYAVQMDGSSKPDTVQDRTPTLTVPDKQSKVMATAYAVDLYNGEMGGVCSRH